MSLKVLSDAELLTLLRDGDHLAFSELYQRYWKKLLHFALQKTGDSMEAENIVQDIFVSLWNRRETLPVHENVGAYLTVSVKYRVIKLFHQTQKRILFGDEALATADLLDDSTREQLELAQMQEMLEHLINQLPEKAQLIYRLHQAGEMSHREIGEAVGMNEKAVNTQLVRARKKLQIGFNFLHSFLL